jgi:NADP-dependent 3-hydroxy acid dehydrogenase YdfG
MRAITSEVRIMKFSPSAVVTGVSTGIGYETALMLADKGFHVFGSVRKTADVDRLKTEFGERFTPLIFDPLHCAFRARCKACFANNGSSRK